MNTRLQQFMNAENLSQSQFADRIGVARASISHIMGGRNKPGFDFILGMARAFPALNLDWLITGKGKMYKQLEPQTARSVSTEPTLDLDDGIEGDDLFNAPDAHNTPNDQERLPSRQPSSPTTSSTVPAAAPSSPSVRTAATPSSPRIQAPPRESALPRNIARIIVFYDDNTFQELH